ncbi:hypothetical protein HEP84_55585 [Streptomyces sp. RLB1-33]|nr:hypothetical protein [Streptomyces sp. RLB1-33]
MTSQNVVGRFFDVPGGQVYAHVREGHGPALVFLHYWGGHLSPLEVPDQMAAHIGAFVAQL